MLGFFFGRECFASLIYRSDEQFAAKPVYYLPPSQRTVKLHSIVIHCYPHMLYFFLNNLPRVKSDQSLKRQSFQIILAVQ